MEKENTRSEAQSMIRHVKKRAPWGLLAVFMCAFFLHICGEQAFAQRKPRMLEPGRVAPGSPDLGVASGIRFSQSGGDKVLLTVRGLGLTHPTVASAPGSALVLRWAGTRFPQSTDRKDWWKDYGWDILTLKRKESDNWWKEYNLPLVQRVVAESIDNQMIQIKIIGPNPLKIENIDGMAGSDQLVITLRLDRPMPVAQPPSGPRPLMPGDPMAIRAPVTMNFREAPLQDAFRMLASIQKLNLVLDPSVPDQPITLSFSSIPFNEAFSYLLRMNDLTYAMMGRTLVVGKLESIGRTTGKEITRGYQLSYGDLAQVPGVLTSLVTLSKPPAVDTRMRNIYVTGTEDQHREVANILQRLDHPGQQVMIFSQIMEVNDTASQELETLLSAVHDQWSFNFGKGGMTAGGDYANVPFEAASIPGWNLGSGGTLGNVVPNSGLKLLTGGLKALETSNKGKVLANPSVIAVDGQKALIKLTQDLRYVSGRDDSNNPTYSTESVGPTLEFTPTVGREGMVTLKIKVETGSIVGWRTSGNSEVPETSKRSVETMVRVRNGEPFVVGGLHNEAKTKGINRIPILGYLPILGELFKTRNDKHERSEVAMIIIPYILDVPESQIPVHELPAVRRP